MADHTPKKYPSLRFFITVTIMIIVGFVLLLSVGFYYIKTSSILRKTSRDSIVRELNQVNDTIQDQVETIDSVIPLFMSNEVIQNALENKENIEEIISMCVHLYDCHFLQHYIALWCNNESCIELQ